jgi:hypothetical protein
MTPAATPPSGGFGFATSHIARRRLGMNTIVRAMLNFIAVMVVGECIVAAISF